MPHFGDGRSRRRLLTIGAGLCALVVAVSVVGLAGGLDPAPAHQLPVVAADQRDEGDPWDVTIEAAVLAADLEPATLLEEGYWLAVIAAVEITADESRSDVYEILCAREVAGLAREPRESSVCPGAIAAHDVRLVRDGSAASTLHPGLPERVAFLWELARDTPPPTEVHVQIVGKTYREDTLTGRMGWLDGAPRAQLTVPVEDRREEV